MVGLFLGKGDGTFQRERYVTSPGFDLANISLADINGDGTLDMIVGQSWESGAQVIVYLGSGGQIFQPVQRMRIQGNPSGGGRALLADLNHDGNLDIAEANGNGIAIFSGAGDGTFFFNGTFYANRARSSLIVVNLGGQGALDLAVINGDLAGVTVLLSEP